MKILNYQAYWRGLGMPDVLTRHITNQIYLDMKIKPNFAFLDNINFYTIFSTTLQIELVPVHTLKLCLDNSLREYNQWLLKWKQKKLPYIYLGGHKILDCKFNTGSVHNLPTTVDLHVFRKAFQ